MATLPDPVKVLPKAAREMWLEVFNGAVSDQGDIDANKIAWGAVKRKWHKGDDDKWVEKGTVLYEDEAVLVLDVGKATRDELRAERDKRSQKYGIGIKEGGHLTPPAGFPTAEGDYADPVNFSYPIDAEHIQAARSYFNQDGQREDGGYSTEEWGIIGGRIAAKSGEEYTYSEGKIQRKEQKSVDLEDEIRVIRDAFYAQLAPSGRKPTIERDMWVQRVMDDAVIVEAEDGLRRYPYERKGDIIQFGVHELVQLDYKPVAKQVQFRKADDEKRLVYGVVMEPEEVDTQGDTTSAEEIELACHRFMLNRQRLDLNHQREIEKQEAAIVECYIAPVAMDFPGGTVKPGSWLMVTKIYDDEMWTKVKAGELGGYSIRGRGVRTRRNE